MRPYSGRIAKLPLRASLPARHGRRRRPLEAPLPSTQPSALETLALLARHPRERLWRAWNWKAAVTSAIIRAAIFFGANLTAGWRAAGAAFATEVVFRTCTSGFYGTITEAFAAVRPVWTATLTTLLLLPALSHTLEFLLHYFRGTPELARSITISMAFTGLSTAFNLFAMRRGALVIGAGRQSLAADLRRMPRLIAEFALATVRLISL